VRSSPATCLRAPTNLDATKFFTTKDTKTTKRLEEGTFHRSEPNRFGNEIGVVRSGQMQCLSFVHFVVKCVCHTNANLLDSWSDWDVANADGLDDLPWHGACQ
jgi:hypothetical protein